MRTGTNRREDHDVGAVRRRPLLPLCPCRHLRCRFAAPGHHPSSDRSTWLDQGALEEWPPVGESSPHPSRAMESLRLWVATHPNPST